MKRFNLYQISEGVLCGYCIGIVYAEEHHQIGNAHIFQNGETIVATSNFVRVEEVPIEE